MRIEQLDKFYPRASEVMRQHGLTLKTVVDKNGVKRTGVYDKTGRLMNTLDIPASVTSQVPKIDKNTIANKYRTNSVAFKMGAFSQDAKGGIKFLAPANRRQGRLSVRNKNQGEFNAFFQDYKDILAKLTKSGEIYLLSPKRLAVTMGLRGDEHGVAALKALNILAQGSNFRNKELKRKVKDIVLRNMGPYNRLDKKGNIEEKDVPFYKDTPVKYNSLIASGNYVPTNELLPKEYNDFLSGKIDADELKTFRHTQRDDVVAKLTAKETNKRNKEVKGYVPSFFAQGLDPENTEITKNAPNWDVNKGEVSKMAELRAYSHGLDARKKILEQNREEAAAREAEEQRIANENERIRQAKLKRHDEKAAARAKERQELLDSVNTRHTNELNQMKSELAQQAKAAQEQAQSAFNQRETALSKQLEAQAAKLNQQLAALTELQNSITKQAEARAVKKQEKENARVRASKLKAAEEEAERNKQAQLEAEMTEQQRRDAAEAKKRQAEEKKFETYDPASNKPFRGPSPDPEGSPIYTNAIPGEAGSGGAFGHEDPYKHSTPLSAPKSEEARKTGGGVPIPQLEINDDHPLRRLKRPEPPTSNDPKDWDVYLQNIDTYKEAVNSILDPENRIKKEAESAEAFKKAINKETQQHRAEEAFANNLREIEKLTRHAKEKLFVTEEQEKRAKKHKNLNVNDFLKMFRRNNATEAPEHGSYGGIAQALALANKAIPPTTWRG
jgi:hypothetical protein